jgi:hypothetical protein
MGGGGDDGYEKRQQGIEQSKAQARAKLNAMFGAVTDPAALGLPSDPKDAYFREKMNLNPSTPLLVPDEVASQDPGYGQFMEGMNNRLNDVSTTTAQNAQARDGLYQTVRDNAFTAGKRALDEKQQDAARKLKFELFATGQAGGSGDIDENAKQKRTYNQGLIDLGAKADSAKADFRNADEDTRLQLLQSIDNGMDQGSALSTATQRMQIAADKAAADANGTAVGDLFNTGSEFYNASQYARGRQAAQQQAFQMFPQQLGTGLKRNAATTGVTTRLPGE